MKKTLLVSLLVLAVMLTLSACTKKNEEPKEEIFSGSLKDLLTKKRSLKCTYDYNSIDGSFSGTIYIANEKSRSDVQVNASGQEFDSHSIIKNDWLYTWSSLMPQGTKMQISKFKMKKESKNIEEKEYQEALEKMEREMDYKCIGWIADNSKFNEPSNIQFMDLTAQRERLQEMSQEVEQGNIPDICAMCDNAPTPELVQQCKEKAGCE